MHVSLTSCVHRHEHACTTCLEINLIPINKKIPLHDPSIIYSEKYDSEPSLKQTHIIHIYKYLNILVLLQVPKPVFPETGFLHQHLLKLLGKAQITLESIPSTGS